MANIPGILGYLKPSAVSSVTTKSNTVSLPGGARIIALIGLGGREEVPIPKVAVTATTITFASQTAPILSNMYSVYRNAIETTDFTVCLTTGLFTVTATVGDQIAIKYVATNDYNTPQLFFSPSELYAKHGYPSETNTLALGAQMAFENGAPAVLAVQADPTDLDFSDSYKALETETCNFVVPLPVRYFLDVFAAGKSHVENMSSMRNRKERMLLIGGVDGLTFDDVVAVTTPTTLSSPSYATEQDSYVDNKFIGDYVGKVIQTTETYGPINDAWGVPLNYGDSFRVAYFFPDRVVRMINTVATTLNGFYVAAAAAGWFANQGSITTPLTLKALNGFVIEQSRKFGEPAMDLLAEAGIIVMEALGSGGQARHGKTTTQSGIPEQEEISIIQISDYVATTVRSRLQAEYVGGVIDGSTIPSMNAKLDTILAALAKKKIIFDSANASVKQDRIEPRQINIQFDCQPIYPLNWIFINFSLGLL